MTTDPAALLRDRATLWAAAADGIHRTINALDDLGVPADAQPLRLRMQVLTAIERELLRAADAIDLTRRTA